MEYQTYKELECKIFGIEIITSRAQICNLCPHPQRVILVYPVCLFERKQYFPCTLYLLNTLQGPVVLFTLHLKEICSKKHYVNDSQLILYCEIT